MGELIDWLLATEPDKDLKAEDVGAVIGKYVIGASRVEPTRSDIGNAVLEFDKMVHDKTFQDMCRLIQDFI